MLRFGDRLILDMVTRERWTKNRGVKSFMMMQFQRIHSTGQGQGLHRVRAESRECEQLPNGQIGKTGCGNGTGTALTGDWPAGSLWPHRNARSAPFVVGSRRQNGCPATDRHNVDGAPSNHARDGRDDPPWRQSTWAWAAWHVLARSG